MLRKVSRLGLCPALGAMLILAVPVLAGNGEQDVELKAMTLLREGTACYEKGELAKAKEAFDQMLALKPGSQVALRMQREAELGLLARMASEKDEPLASTARKVLDMMGQAVRQERRVIENPEKLLTDFQSPDLRAYLSARAELVGYGAYAVPHLLQFLTRQGPDNQAIVARTVSTIRDIGRAAVPPLLEAAAADDELVQIRVVGALGQFGDRRAVPVLLSLWEAPGTPEIVVEAAGEALKAITSQSPDALGSAVEQYKTLVELYVREEAASVGFLYGGWQEIWRWNPAAANWQDRLTYELLPTYLYCQQEAVENALKALRLDPEDADLKALLLTALCRQRQLARMYAELKDDEQVRADAAARAVQLDRHVPLAGHLMDADVVGKALRQALALGDAATSLYLVELLGGKAGLDTSEGAEVLVAALDFPHRDVRCRASIEIVRASPTGAIGDPQKVMEVLSVALKHAATRRALLIMDNLQLRNKLTAVVEGEGWQASSCDVDVGPINAILNLQPAVDIVFMTGNVDDVIFRGCLGKLKADARTASLPLYAVVNPDAQAVDLTKYEGITGALSTDRVQAAKVAPLLAQAAQAGQIPTERERADLVLMGAEALKLVDPRATRYPVELAEAGLIASLSGYGERLSQAAVDNLARFGSANALSGLAQVASDEAASVQLRASACQAIAAVAARTGEELPDMAIEALMAALGSDEAALREAAAEALSVSGLSSAELLEIMQASAPAPVAPPAVAPAPGVEKGAGEEGLFEEAK